jgi:hypothetical protein
MKYEVLVDGVSAFKKTTKEDTFDREVFPPEFRQRPETGEVTLTTDGEVISVLRPEGVETPAPEIKGVGGAVAEDATGTGG